jgi:CheY-like chemotaxis protein
MGTKTILVVDDEMHISHLLRFALAKVACTLVAAYDGRQALAAAAAQTFDLAIVDYDMPGMTGIETVHALKIIPACSKMPIVMLTGRGERSIRAQAESLGISLFLNKPFSPTELRKHVTSLLGL